MVLVSAAISSGKGCIVIVGLAVQSATLVMQFSGWRRSLSVSNWLRVIPTILARKGQLGIHGFFAEQKPHPSASLDLV